MKPKKNRAADWIEAGRREERKRIVAYLRADGWHESWLGARLGIAQQIEDGRHCPTHPKEKP